MPRAGRAGRRRRRSSIPGGEVDPRRRTTEALDVVAGAALPVREFRTRLRAIAIESSGAPV
eukprot:12016505-Alexandrium_andersonii.AAC.1